MRATQAHSERVKGCMHGAWPLAPPRAPRAKAAPEARERTWSVSAPASGSRASAPRPASSGSRGPGPHCAPTCQMDQN
eukprot:388165-Pleurochrysis_carterae.AAC.1